MDAHTTGLEPHDLALIIVARGRDGPFQSPCNSDEIQTKKKAGALLHEKGPSRLGVYI
jgi:hypothetical protein